MSAQIRKHQTILICSGLAVIGFGLWSIVRTIMFVYLDPLQFSEMFIEQDQVSEELYRAIVIAVLAVLLALDLLFRLYVGLNAIRLGQGQKRKKRFIFFSAAFLIISLCSDFSFFLSAVRGSFTTEVFASLIVDITNCIAFYRIITSSLALLRLSKAETA